MPRKSNKPQSLASHIGAKLAQRQQTNAKEPPARGLAHLLVIARAGTGKTTTTIEGLKVLKGLRPGISPSPQQEAIWQQMKLSSTASTIVTVAFNKSIAVELQGRVPMGVDAMTMHSMGFKAVTKAFGRVNPTQWNVPDIIGRIMRKDVRDLRRDNPVLLKAAADLVSKAKGNLVEPTPENLDYLAAHYDIELNGSRSQVYELVPHIIEECKRPRGSIDFDDMVWLPVVLNLPLFRYDLLIQDEAQDLTPCQQQLALRSGKRIVAVGDPAQSLYGFAGADTKAMQRLQEKLNVTDEGCVTLPLTVTRRCGHAIVAEAKQYVPDFEAHESNVPGRVSDARYPLQGKKGDKTELPYEKTYMPMVGDGDFVICRCNAPLVSQCFRFIKMGRKATIQGRDIGQGILALVEKLKASDVPELIVNISDWYAKECEKENSKRMPSDSKLIALSDKYDCLLAFTESATTIEQVKSRIEKVFTDDKHAPGVRLSSIHRAKGLEAKRVFFLLPEEAPCPHPMAKSAWQQEAEICCLYVGITRAIEELVYVR